MYLYETHLPVTNSGVPRAFYVDVVGLSFAYRDPSRYIVFLWIGDQDTIAKSLEGDYRPEHLFALRQSLAAFHYYQQLVVEVDQEIQRQLGSLETATTAEPTVPKRTKASAYQRRRYEPKTFDLRSELYRIFGVDLTNVPGISAITAQTILCEIGTEVSRFRNASAFASWLGLCPENKISGGKVLYTKSRRIRSRANARRWMKNCRGFAPLQKQQCVSPKLPLSGLLATS